MKFSVNTATSWTYQTDGLQENEQSACGGCWSLHEGWTPSFILIHQFSLSSALSFPFFPNVCWEYVVDAVESRWARWQKKCGQQRWGRIHGQTVYSLPRTFPTHIKGDSMTKLYDDHPIRGLRLQCFTVNPYCSSDQLKFPHNRSSYRLDNLNVY